MPYLEDITEPLISTLTRTGGLPTPQLAGHAANLEFWVGEVKHAFMVINGYGERFKKLQEGERLASTDPTRFGKPMRPSLSDHELKALRHRLTDSVTQVLSRSYSEGLVSEKEIEEYAEILDLDSRELKRKKRPQRSS